MTKTGNKVDARRRARERKAILDAQRAERDEKVEALAIDYFEAVGRVEDLTDELAQAQSVADSAVLRLLELGETVDRVATLTDQPTSAVRRVKREATQALETDPTS